MKKVKIIFFIPALLMLALGSCTKETVGEGLAGEEFAAVGGERVIALSFGESAKATLENDYGELIPHFSAGDRILVSTGSAKEICTVVLDDAGKPTISTSLSGTLTAVFPAECASLSGNSINGVVVPAVQSGKFSDALIARANNIGSSNTAVFDSQTAILRFYVDKNIGVQSVSVTSSAAIASDGSKTITVTAPSGSTLDAVTDDPDKRLCYISVLTGVSSSGFTFKGTTTTQGTVTRASDKAVSLSSGKIYNAFIPYYIDFGDGGKWGYCNIGAFLPEDRGLYFAWGATVGYGSGHTFYSSDAPFNEGSFSSYYKYNSTDRIDILEPADDAATVNWGTGWCMPKGDINTGNTEFGKLNGKTYWGYYSASYGSVNPTGLYVFLPADAPGKSAGTYGSVDGLDLSKAKLFFPNTGQKYDAVSTSSGGYYWSGVLYDYSTSHRAWSMHFDASSVNCIAYNDRNFGLCIRPVYDDAMRSVESAPMIYGGKY